MSDLLDLLLDAGLIQFGWFEPGGAPFKLSLEMLPAYPDVLKAVAAEARPFLAQAPCDRLVCLPDSLPLGIALSLETGIPLVYSRGSGEAAVYDLVGAYDIGHPALLLVNTLDAAQDLSQFVGGAHRVGLNILQAVAVVNLGRLPPPADFAVRALLHLPDAVHHLAGNGRLPVRHAQVVLNFLNPHPDSTAP